MQTTTLGRLYGRYTSALRRIVNLLAAVAAIAIVIMILVTCVDVVGRRIGYPLKGTYDIVELLSAIMIAGALPYTTACKGHVAIEFLLQRLSRRGRLILDIFVRSASILMFGFLTWRFIQYGGELRASGQVTLTLQWPVFWLPYWMAVCTAVMIPVLLYLFMHPEKELMKP
ncbi:MAG: TRAP transporter small permease [Planctomycetaceae bacterium]|nr:MAG: TRAP transporter small permease [Planctomycetaceae bacterium]